MINKKIIAKNFSASVENYENLALVQKKVAQKLCNLSANFIKNDDLILDLGSGTSFIAKNLFQTKIYEVDISLNMLKNWNRKDFSLTKINADIENLPFKNNVFDVVISSFALQWIEDFNKLFASLKKVIKNKGIIALSLPLKNSLSKIKDANIKSQCEFSFQDFFDAKNIKNILRDQNFEEIFYFEERIEQGANSASEFLKNIKKIGANYCDKKNFVKKENLQKFNDFFLKENYNKDYWVVGYFLWQKK